VRCSGSAARCQVTEALRLISRNQFTARRTVPRLTNAISCPHFRASSSRCTQSTGAISRCAGCGVIVTVIHKLSTILKLVSSEKLFARSETWHQTTARATLSGR
jgi:hypothetical protein